MTDAKERYKRLMLNRMRNISPEEEQIIKEQAGQKAAELRKAAANSPLVRRLNNILESLR